MARAVGVGDLLADRRSSGHAVRAAGRHRPRRLGHVACLRRPSFATCWTRPFTRRVRRIGTLGEADLSPLAQLFLPLVGQGEAELGGRVMPGREALGRAGIEPPVLGPKDAIALLNANACSVGTGALALHDAGLALRAQTAAGALSLEAAGANLSPIDPRVVAPSTRARAGRGLGTAAVAAQGQRSLEGQASATGAGPAVVSLPRPGERCSLRPARSRQQPRSSPISMVPATARPCWPPTRS